MKEKIRNLSIKYATLLSFLMKIYDALLNFKTNTKVKYKMILYSPAVF